MPAKPIVALMPFIECAMRKISSTVSGSSGCSSMRTTARLSSWRCSRPSARNMGRYSETSTAGSALAVDEVERGGQAELARAGDALGRPHHEVAAGGQRVDEPAVQRVADLLGEVDDRVAAHDEVIGRRLDRHAKEIPERERHDAPEVSSRLSVREPPLQRRGGCAAAVVLAEVPQPRPG